MSGLGLILPPTPMLGAASGDFVSANGTGIFTTGNLAAISIAAANKLFVTPRRVDGVERYDRIVVEATAGGTSSKCRAGCFANVNGRPGALLLDSGDIDLSSTAIVSTTIDLTLANCWVWDFILFNNTAATVRGVSSAAASRIPHLTSGLTSSNYGNLEAAHAYGPAPATCPTVSQGDTRWFRVEYRIV